MSKELSTIKDAPIVFSITPESLIEVKKEQDELIAKVPENIEDLEIELYKKAKRRVAKLRVATEKERKELKSAALSYGKLVDSTAADAQKPVAEIENVYEKLITEYDNHFAELERIAVEKEKARITAIKEKIIDLKYFRAKLSLDTKATEIESIIAEFKAVFAEKFNYAEFREEAVETANETMRIFRAKFDEHTEREKQKAEQEAQRKIDEEKRIAFEAEKAAFEEKQREAQDKIDTELAAIQRQKDEAAHEANVLRMVEEHANQEEELKKQSAIDEERRKEAEKEEDSRLEQIRIENEARKLTQEKEDRVRNAAPELLEALELMVKMYEEIKPTGGYQGYYEESISAIKLAKGE